MRVGKWGDAEEAKRLIDEAIARYDAHPAPETASPPPGLSETA